MEISQIDKQANTEKPSYFKKNSRKKNFPIGLGI